MSSFGASLLSSPHKKWWILFAMSVSLGMTYIDQTAVAIALPKIQQDLKLSSIAAQWVINSFLLSLAVFIILGGRLGDIFQTQRIFMVGILIFLVSSLACAVTTNFILFIISRTLQGLGAALLLPNAGVIIINTFDITERGKAMGIYIGSALIFTPLALLMGGVFTEYLSWRLIFWINLPLCLICLIIAYSLLKPYSITQSKKVDWLGAITLIFAITTLVTALMESVHWGWGSPLIIGLLLSSLFFSICFYFLEMKGRSIIDFTVFDNSLFSFAIFILFTMSVPLGFFVFDAIFYQNVLDFSPTVTALLFFPNIATVMIAAPLAGRSLDLLGYQKPVIFGFILFIAGLAFKAVALPFQNYWYLLPSIILINAGSAFIVSPLNTSALSTITQEKRSGASGIIYAVRQISTTIIFALLTLGIFGLNNELLSYFISANKSIYPTLTLEHLTHIFNDQPIAISNKNYSTLSIMVKASFTSAYTDINYICLVIFILVFFVTLYFFRHENKLLSKEKIE